MRIALPFCLLLSLLFSGCSTTTTPSQAPGFQSTWPAILKSSDRDQIRAAGRTDALADIKDGHPRICFTGGYAAFPVGVSEKYWPVIKNLPTVPLPVGCTEPLLGPAAEYAAAYNTEIMHYLDSQH
jgi:hypothetical protein